MNTLNYFEVADFLRIPQNDFEEKFRHGDYKEMPHKIVNKELFFDKEEVLAFLIKKFGT